MRSAATVGALSDRAQHRVLPGHSASPCREGGSRPLLPGRFCVRETALCSSLQAAPMNVRQGPASPCCGTTGSVPAHYPSDHVGQGPASPCCSTTGSVPAHYPSDHVGQGPARPCCGTTGSVPAHCPSDQRAWPPLGMQISASFCLVGHTNSLLLRSMLALLRSLLYHKERPLGALTRAR